MNFTGEEIARLTTYLRDKFGNGDITIMIREKNPDSAEVLLKTEFIGVIYKDTEEDDVSYDFNMAILDLDLPAVA